ncbi:MAG: glycosyltransferase family 4 protein [Ignavibacteriae bacterium]|nr:glycosyltransferase family 4 protein [Ignavibacteria bacterium]MBI3363855.1 glycosyltransferase family 4 protein [Ignavibacteriota bacterium]
MDLKPFTILLTNSTDIYAGGEFYVYSLARELQARGHDVLVACKSGNLLREKCEQAGVRIFPVDFPPQGKLMRHVNILRRLMKDRSIEIVHTNTNYDRTAGAFAARLEGKAHITNVHSFHSLRHNVTHWLRNRWATDHFIVDGVCVKELLAKEDGIPASRISVIYLGVDPVEMRRDELLRQKVRQEFGFTDEEVVVGNVARLVPFKGHEYLLQAFAACASNFFHARLLLVGDGELYEKLTDLAAVLGVQDRVMFAGFRDDLQAVYSAFDLYVHPSIEGGGETFPFAVLQALSQELPILVTRVGDVAEMVEEGVNGFVVPDRDHKALMEKLEMLLRDQSVRRGMGERSRHYLLRRFTTQNMVDAVENIYTRILQRRH